jgi:hypothetical protein
MSGPSEPRKCRPQRASEPNTKPGGVRKGYAKAKSGEGTRARLLCFILPRKLWERGDSGRRVAQKGTCKEGGRCWVPRNKSKGFRPVRFVSAFGSWVGAQSGEILFPISVLSTKEDNSAFRRTWRHLLCPRSTRPLAEQELLPQPQRTRDFQAPASPIPDENSTRNVNKIIPDLALMATHLKRSNRAEHYLGGANHVVEFKTPQGLSHNDNTSITLGAALEKRPTKVNKEYHKCARDLMLTCTAPQPSNGGPLKRN